MSEPRIPTICLDPSAVAAFGLFNPNDWTGASRGVVQSCATELAALQYAADQIAAACSAPQELCAPHFQTLSHSWARSSWDIGRGIYFGQVPAVHILIEAFLTGLKSLLDLTVQLLSTERVVSVALDGFHRDKTVYGGKVMNALANNVKKGRGRTAEAIRALLAANKEAWLDDAISARDNLAHPHRGAQQLMFELLLRTSHGALVLAEVRPPTIGGLPIDEYATRRLGDARELSSSILRELRVAA